jgi:hypothetical protein
LVRFGIACAGSCLAFWIAVSPIVPKVFGMRSAAVVFSFLNAPASLLNRAFPFWLRSAAASSFGGNAPYIPWPWYHWYRSDVRWSMLYGYLQVAIPANVLFLYGVAAAIHLLRRLASERLQVRDA